MLRFWWWIYKCVENIMCLWVHVYGFCLLLVCFFFFSVVSLCLRVSVTNLYATNFELIFITNQPEYKFKLHTFQKKTQNQTKILIKIIEVLSQYTKKRSRLLSSWCEKEKNRQKIEFTTKITWNPVISLTFFVHIKDNKWTSNGSVLDNPCAKV